MVERDGDQEPQGFVDSRLHRQRSMKRNPGIVSPAFNEQGNIRPLHDDIREKPG
ncbi:MAG: hypothetical protein JXA20_10820 [Spirochaetes bacterium]|nr:hypothetical protein [Spirochaetota bacterium]